MKSVPISQDVSIFINYFNILTTPGSFLIDKDHKIIMRSFSLDELQDFFQKTYKNSEE